jgi:hypothetical protein
MNRLDAKAQIGKLASDLGLKKTSKPVSQIVHFVRKRIRYIAAKYKCQSLQALLKAAAGDLGTVFREVHSGADLETIVKQYVAKGEAIFANLPNELRKNDYGITIKRQRAQAWEPPFVSVIDCRGDKIFRSYFTKWHELAHLLTLTPQMRLVFRCTHGAALQDPEEALMDIIAGELGFFSELLPIDGASDVSFKNIDRIRSEFCPEASYQASLIGIVKALPQPCTLLHVEHAHKKRQDPDEPPALRAIHVTVNQAARDAGLQMHRWWRVPENSVIHEVFRRQRYAEAQENLDWWTTSDGGKLPSCPILVKAKPASDFVLALVIPQD